MAKVELALCQMHVSVEKEKNLEKAAEMIRKAAARGAQIVALPEMFNTPYSSKFFQKFAEEAGGETFQFLASLAKELSIYLVGGSIPEADGDRIYNTSFSFDREGNLVGRHRKVHLFDIDVKGGVSFKESDTLSAGKDMTIFDTEYGKIGVAICYDIRFPEWYRHMALEGVKLVLLPGAFNMTTGPAHWDLTLRARAVDNQIYFAAISPAREVGGRYQAYGHSCVVSPWGEFCGKTDSRESIVYAQIDLDYIDEVREQLPLLAHRRPELYTF